MSAHASASEPRYTALLRRTREWVELGRFDAAAECCREAIECMPDRAGPRGVLAQALASAGLLEAAADAAAAALERAPRDPLMLHLSASIALQRSLPRVALEFTRRALQIDPHDQRALADMAFVMESPDAHGGALDDTVRATDIGTPPGHASLQSFNQQVATDLAGTAAVVAKDGQTPLVGGRRVNGVFDLEAHWVAPLRELLHRAVDGYLATLDVAASHPVMTGRPRRRSFVGWANLMTRGDHERAHIHEAGWLSGIYYVEMPERGGALLLGGHCSVPDPGRTLRRLEPRPGLLVLFPSYLCHRTEPFAGCGRRISIAFDVSRMLPGER